MVSCCCSTDSSASSATSSSSSSSIIISKTAAAQHHVHHLAGINQNHVIVRVFCWPLSACLLHLNYQAVNIHAVLSRTAACGTWVGWNVTWKVLLCIGIMQACWFAVQLSNQFIPCRNMPNSHPPDNNLCKISMTAFIPRTDIHLPDPLSTTGHCCC
jgi:hypothetical protein